jgi:hypothetical protein
MAKGTKTGGKDFSKGQSGNPAGRPKLSETEKRVQELTREQLCLAWERVIMLPQEEIEAMANPRKMMSKKQKAKRASFNFLELLVIGIMGRGMSRGEMYDVDLFLNRILGKPKQAVDLTSDGDKIQNQIVVLEIPANGRDETSPTTR